MIDIGFIGMVSMPKTRSEFLEMRKSQSKAREQMKETDKRLRCPGYETLLNMRGKAQNGV